MTRRTARSSYTLIETAKLNGLDPEAYLRHAIGRIADHPAKRIITRSSDNAYVVK